MFGQRHKRVFDYGLRTRLSNGFVLYYELKTDTSTYDTPVLNQLFIIV